MNRSRIVVIGSLNADFVTRVNRFPSPGETMIGLDHKIFPGGKGANQACAAAKLGGSVCMIGQVGTDPQGEELRNNLACAGVDITQVSSTATRPTGIAQITIDAKGENQIVIVPGANGSFTPEELRKHRELIASAKLVLLQLEIPIETVEVAARLAKESGAVVILDPAPARALSPDLLAHVDYLTPNETELSALAREPPSALSVPDAVRLADSVRSNPATQIIVKMGDQGALLSSGNHHQLWPAFRVKAVDTTAAGDAFNAAFAVALAEGAQESDAGRFACAVAAICVTKPGAQPSMPFRDEVDAFLKSRPE